MTGEANLIAYHTRLERAGSHALGHLMRFVVAKGWSQKIWVSFLIALTIGLSIVIFLFELSIPLGVAAGVPQVVIVLLSIWMPWRHAPLALAAAATGLITVDYFASAPGGATELVFFHRGLVIFTLWIVAVLLWEHKTAADKLAEANRTKSQFLSRMSHELRTPLNAIIGFSELIKLQVARDNPDKQIEYAEAIHRSGAYLLQLISDLMDISKVEAGTVELRDEEVDPARTIAASIDLLKHRAQQAGLDLVVHVPCLLPRLRLDERALKQVLLNLLTNAVKFTPSGGTISVKALLAEDGYFVLSVADSGIGIPADEVSRVLQPFEQGSNRGARSREGVGLGLALVKSLVEMQEGVLELQSCVGTGTVVTVRFPPARVVKAQPKQAA